jgi:MYXO-CTERM domain-containing protein
MTTTMKLLMFAAAGLLTPVVLEGAADAGTVKQFTVLEAPINDKAPASNGRLRRTNEEQPGREMPGVVCLGTPKTKCLYFAASTELPPTTAGGPPRPARDRVQMSLTKFTLAQDATGNVIANIDAANSEFVTDNDGNEYRNCNHMEVLAVDENHACTLYNYQPNNTNDTKRYIQCYNSDGVKVLAQGQPIFAKNNDDAAMTESGGGCSVQGKTGNNINLVCWGGANGNGRDDGWLFTVNLDTTNPTAWTAKRGFDISLAQREERSHGHCSTSAADRNTAICSWTEGNNQPQRDGTWIAAIDITPGKFNGSDQQGALIWKEQVEGRKDIDGLRTYSMRAAHKRVQLPDATGALVDSDMMFWYSNDLRGNNRNNEKGGRTLRTMMGVIKADKAGMSYVMPLADSGKIIKGLGGTHLHAQLGVFGTTDALKPGVMFVNGSHTGGHFNGQARTLLWDQTANTFSDGGMTSTAPFDRHLYPNYLGNNPGNQGRNYAGSVIMANPFVGQGGNKDAHIMLFASTGKNMTELDKPELKASAFITIIPITSVPTAVTPTDPTDPTDPQDPSDPQDPQDPSDPGAGESLGGCSTGGTTGGLSLLLIGLAAFIRRRR